MLWKNPFMIKFPVFKKKSLSFAVTILRFSVGLRAGNVLSKLEWGYKLQNFPGAAPPPNILFLTFVCRLVAQS